jgi:hypothetical protein
MTDTNERKFARQTGSGQSSSAKRIHHTHDHQGLTLVSKASPRKMLNSTLFARDSCHLWYFPRHAAPLETLAGIPSGMTDQPAPVCCAMRVGHPWTSPLLRTRHRACLWYGSRRLCCCARRVGNPSTSPLSRPRHRVRRWHGSVLPSGCLRWRPLLRATPVDQ